MSVLVDTSALLAVLDADDANHRAASRVWDELLEGRERLLTTNYIIVETVALAQARLGLGAVGALVRDVIPLFNIEWVTRADHEAGTAAVLAARRRDLSLVDCTSFEVMGRLGIARCFSFDRHFHQMGFECLP